MVLNYRPNVLVPVPAIGEITHQKQCNVKYHSNTKAAAPALKVRMFLHFLLNLNLKTIHDYFLCHSVPTEPFK